MNKMPDNTEQNIEENKKDENEIALITAKRIRMALAERNLSQQDLADLSGVSKASISQYVHARNVPASNNAMAMSAILGVRPEWLMGFGSDNIEEYIDPTYHQIMELWKLLTSEQRELIVRNAYMLAKTNGDLD